MVSVVGTTTGASGSVGCGPGTNSGGVVVGAEVSPPGCPGAMGEMGGMGGMGAEGAVMVGGAGSGPSPPHATATGVAAMRTPRAK